MALVEKLEKLFRDLLVKYDDVAKAKEQLAAAASEEKKDKQRELTKADKELLKQQAQTYLLHNSRESKKITFTQWKQMVTKEYIEEWLNSLPTDTKVIDLTKPPIQKNITRAPPSLLNVNALLANLAKPHVHDPLPKNILEETKESPVVVHPKTVVDSSIDDESNNVVSEDVKKKKKHHRKRD